MTEGLCCNSLIELKRKTKKHRRGYTKLKREHFGISIDPRYDNFFSSHSSVYEFGITEATLYQRLEISLR